MINVSCCMYVDQSGQITDDLREIRKQAKILQEVTQDDTSWGFSELWKELTSWLPDSMWLKQLFVTVIIIILLSIILCIAVRCGLWCFQNTGD